MIVHTVTKELRLTKDRWIDIGMEVRNDNGVMLARMLHIAVVMRITLCTQSLEVK